MREISLLNSKIIIGVSAMEIDKYVDRKKTVIITDENLFRIYEDRLSPWRLIVLKAGERSKTLKTVQGVYRRLLELDCDRSHFILGFGGGIVCDITGFVASTFLRGIRFGFLPTTLLAQTDAAIGGKNGVNFDGYKNMIGTINQPQFVIIDTELLKTLPEQELKNGYAEIIKHAVIGDASLFERLEKEDVSTLLNPNTLKDILFDSIKVKVDIVSQDEKEKGGRRKLNFGHTFGHAIESISSFSHGEAVSIGMVIEAKLSSAKGLLSHGNLLRILDLLKKFGLPTDQGRVEKKLLCALKRDKKREGSLIHAVLIENIGRAKVEQIEIEEIKRLAKSLNLADEVKKGGDYDLC